MTGRFSKIRFGDGLTVTPEDAGVIRVDSDVGGGGALEWSDVGTAGQPSARGQLGATSYTGTPLSDGATIPATSTDLINMGSVTNGLKITAAGTYFAMLHGSLLVIPPFPAGRSCGVRLAINSAPSNVRCNATFPNAAAGSLPWESWFGTSDLLTVAAGDQITMQSLSYVATGEMSWSPSGTVKVATMELVLSIV